MARTKPAFMPRPRILTSPYQVAALLGRGEEWFRQRRLRLEAAGFPIFDPLLGGWDLNAIEVWLDCRSGLEQQSSPDRESNPWDEALQDGHREPALR